ncbi:MULTISPECIES: glycosyltransferase family 2 protein [unclassified Anabaena]|uniref:glycosyltransferase family 2 protein n=1 Tax=unclassified Anabaena TaxID=2619674 RepID=UPI0039C6363D
MPKVSVVIPAYNAMTYLPKTLESVLRQTFTDFEVLIINDGSSDCILDWSASVTDQRVKVISQENQGLSGARNTGIAQAQGEYIAFLDADDLWAPTKLEKQVRCFEDNPSVGLVHNWTILIDETDKPTGEQWSPHLEGNIWEQIIVINSVSSGAAIVRRCCFETIGVFARDLSGTADWDMWIRIAYRYPFAVIKEPLTLYRQHSQNMSKDCQHMLTNARIVIEKAFQSVPLELLYLRNRAYAYFYRYQAWVSLYSGNYKQAIYCRNQALLHNPNLRLSKNFIHLSWGIFFTHYIGADKYAAIRSLKRSLKNKILHKDFKFSNT